MTEKGIGELFSMIISSNASLGNSIDMKRNTLIGIKSTLKVRYESYAIWILATQSLPGSGSEMFFRDEPTLCNIESRSVGCSFVWPLVTRNVIFLEDSTFIHLALKSA